MPAHVRGGEAGTVPIKPALQGGVINAKHSLDVSSLWFCLRVLGPLLQEGSHNLTIVIHD